MVTKDVAGDDYVADFPTNQSVIDALNGLGVQVKERDAQAALMALAVDIPSDATTAADARIYANMMVSLDPNAQGRPWKVFKNEESGRWQYYYTKSAWDTPTTAAQAREIIAELNAQFPSEDGSYEWRVGGRDSKSGIYNIEMAKIGSASDDALDPDNPLMMGSDGTPTLIDLGNGQTMGFLSDGRSFTVDPADTDTEVDWENLTSSDVKVVKAGGQDFAVFPDGTKYEVGEKFAGGVNPDDLEVVSQVPLKDGTFAAIFNNGQIFRTGREVKPASVDYSSETGKFQVTQPDGSLNFIDPTYPTGFTGQGGLEGYNMFQQRSGDVEDLGLPEVPARIEQQAGQQFIRGTQGELQPLNDVLDRVIEQAVISGDVDRAIAFDDFRKRPSRADALQMALQYARSPADQTLISAISSGEQYVSPPPAGELQQVGPPADFLQQAYQEFRDSMSGGALPTPEEMEAAMAPPPLSALDEAKLKGLELQNQKFELEIANLQQKGEDDHIAATTKVNNANKTTDANVASKQNSDNINTQNYEDSSSGGNGGGNGDGNGDGGGEQVYGGGDKFNQAAAVEATWSQMSRAQKDLWGNSLSAFKASVGDFKNVESMVAAIDNVLVDNNIPTVGYKNDEMYQTWLEKSGGLNHSATYRSMYERKAPSEWRAILGMEELKETSTAATGATPGDAGYQTEEGAPELYDTGTPSLKEANAEVKQAVEVEQRNEEADTSVTPVEKMSIDELMEMRGIEFPSVGERPDATRITYRTPEQNPGLRLTGDDDAPVGDMAAPFSMASEEDDDAPGRVMSGTEHALAVKAARDKAEGIRYLRPGDEGYSTAQIRANLQEQTDARQQARSEEVAKIIADQEYAADIAERNAAVRAAIANIPGEVEDLRQGAIDVGRDIVNYDIPNPPSMLELATMDIPNPPSLLGGITSGIQQAYSATKGAIIDPIAERVEEVERGKQEARDAPSISRYDYDEGARGIRTNADKMTLVGEEGPEIALFPDGTEIIPMKRKIKPSQAKRLKKRGIRGMQEGGLVFPGVDDVGEASSVDLSKYGGSLPSGVRRTIMGQSIAPSRGYLSRAAGITLPSGQAMRNMLPEEMDILQDVAAQTRIPERAFQRELALGIPSGERRRGSARFLPLSLR